MNDLLESVLELLPVNDYMIAISVANDLKYQWFFLDHASIHKRVTIPALPRELPTGKVFLIFLLSVWGN